MPDLHIITFAVPFPAHYGGAIDVWNRLKALASLGLKINLHCFEYATSRPHDALLEVANEVYYYPKTTRPGMILKGQPYIVSSRKSPLLFHNINSDQSPILFEGIHTTGFSDQLEGRKKLLRAHNIEHQYYAELSNESKGLKSLIYRRESQCLQYYEKQVAPLFDKVFAISPEDYQWYLGHGAESTFLPPFHGQNHMDVHLGHGDYLLYQGDLSLVINQNAVLDMLARLPADGRYPVVVAGRSGDPSFEQKLTSFSNLRREKDVSQEKMIELIQRAHIVLIHSLHEAGMKLKIFPALYFGRFVAATHHSHTHTPLDKAIHYYESEGLQEVLNVLWSSHFSSSHASERKKILDQLPGDIEKAKEIIRYL